MRTLCVVLALCVLAVVPPAAHADDAPAEKPKTVNLVLHKVDVVTAIQQLASMAGANVIVSPKIKGRVTMDFDHTPFRKALRQVAKACGGVAVEKDFGFFMVVPREEVARTKLDPAHAQADAREVREQGAQVDHAANAIKLLAKSLKAATAVNAALKRDVAARKSKVALIQVDQKEISRRLEELREHLGRGEPFDIITVGGETVYLPRKNVTGHPVTLASKADALRMQAERLKEASALLKAAGDKAGAERAFKKATSAYTAANALHELAKSRREAAKKAQVKRLAKVRAPQFKTQRTTTTRDLASIKSLHKEVRALRGEVRDLTALVRQLLEKTR